MPNPNVTIGIFTINGQIELYAKAPIKLKFSSGSSQDSSPPELLVFLCIN